MSFNYPNPNHSYPSHNYPLVHYETSNLSDQPEYLINNSIPGMMFPWDNESYIIETGFARGIYQLYGGFYVKEIDEDNLALWIWKPVWMDYFL